MSKLLPLDLEQKVLCLHPKFGGQPNVTEEISYLEQRDLWKTPLGLFRIFTEKEQQRLIDEMQDIFYNLYLSEVERVEYEESKYYIVPVLQVPFFQDVDRRSLYFKDYDNVLDIIQLN